MGVFNVGIAIGDTERRQWRELSATVDTAAFVSSAPGSVLRDLGLAPDMRHPFRGAGGGWQVMDAVYTWLRVNGREVMTHIAFGGEGGSPMLGSLALNSLFLSVDLVEGRLVPWSYIQDHSWVLPDM